MDKILVLEDDHPSLLLMSEILEKYGYSVIPVTDGLEALSIAESELPDLAIVDVMLPTMNGYQVCERLHSIPKLKSLPVIILTVLNDDQHRIRAEEAGAIDFLNKPFKRVELLSKIKAILSLQKENSSKISFDIICQAFLHAIALRDPNLRADSIRCAYLAERVGKVMSLNNESLLELRYGILLRDIGYLSMPDSSVMLDPNNDNHPELGAEIIDKFSKPVLSTIVRYHHCTLTSPDYPHSISAEQRALLNIAIVCTRYSYLSNSKHDSREVLLHETDIGLWPKEETDCLLLLTKSL